MALVYSVPGKCFLAGEYLAMDGGLCLIANVEPRFELRVSAGSGAVLGLPEGSPAMNFVRRHSSFFQSLDLSFVDPHKGAGGWGASTAQYLTVFAAHAWAAAANDEAVRDLDVRELLENYQRDAWNGEGRAPSGADLVAQMKGGWVFFEKSSGMLQRQAWPFDDLEPYLIRTGEKVATHEHLKQLADLGSAELARLMSRVREAWQNSDAEGFALGLSEYGAELRARGWVTERTRSLLHDLLWQDGVRSAKGCGAMGADLVLALVDRKSLRSFEAWLEESGLSWVRPREKSSPGLALRVESKVVFPEAGL